MKAATTKLDWVIVAGLIALVAIMPFHAFLSVWLGTSFGHEDLFQAWKEVVIVLMGAVAAVSVLRNRRRLARLARPMNYFILGFALIAIVVTLAGRPNATAAAYGVKTDLEFFVAFMIAQLVASEWLANLLGRIALWTGLVVAAFGILLVTVLPVDTLSHFGYSFHTISPYQLIDRTSGVVRTPSTLGGPNQLGSFLILPICLAAVAVGRRRWWYILAAVVLLGGSFVTYSRSAWLGAAAGLLTVLWLSVGRRAASSITAGAALLGAATLTVASRLSHRLHDYLLHARSGATFAEDSTAQHAASLSKGLHQSLIHPIGEGLGAAGPASFHGGATLITENYYLQLALESGWLGLAAFLGALTGLARALWARRRQSVAVALLAALVGNSVVNLFLHGWADSSTALVYWSLAGVVVGQEATRG